MNKFVFVVCGGSEHIEKLNFSLKFLRKYSKNEIIALSDLKRNEIKIEHNNIIQIDTPEDFDHHQASIFIKTGLNKFLPKTHNYCYLDGDIVAINEKVDEIFNFYKPPITFAKDHCSLQYFSPHAMNCSCIVNKIKNDETFKIKISQLFEKIDFSNPKIKAQSQQLLQIFAEYQNNPIKYSIQNITYFIKRYILPIKQFKLKQFKFLKSDKCWYNSDNEAILFDYPYYEKKIWGKTGIIFNFEENLWENRKGEKYEFKAPSCSHLSEYLQKEYGIKIPDNWRHWNGGVFLFNDKSEEFLNFWHEITIKEFSNPYTKTRDQGTLALSVWKFGLENHPNIPEEFNWICEFANKDIDWDKNLGYTKDGFKTKFYPNLLHIYHEWGNKNWSIWQSVANQNQNT